MQHWHPLSRCILRIPNRFSASWEWSHPTSSFPTFCLFDTELFMFVYNMFFLELPCSLSQSKFRAMEHITVTPEKIEESLITIFFSTIFQFLSFLFYYITTHKKPELLLICRRMGVFHCHPLLRCAMHVKHKGAALVAWNAVDSWGYPLWFFVRYHK